MSMNINLSQYIDAILSTKPDKQGYMWVNFTLLYLEELSTQGKTIKL